MYFIPHLMVISLTPSSNTMRAPCSVLSMGGIVLQLFLSWLIDLRHDLYAWCPLFPTWVDVPTIDLSSIPT